jgi:hypothetical protein
VKERKRERERREKYSEKLEISFATITKFTSYV